jgi:hypothetical protein
MISPCILLNSSQKVFQIKVLDFNQIYILCLVRFQVLTAASMKLTAFWDIASCNLEEVYCCFRGAYCLHHQDSHLHFMSCADLLYN